MWDSSSGLLKFKLSSDLWNPKSSDYSYLLKDFKIPPNETFCDSNNFNGTTNCFF